MLENEFPKTLKRSELARNLNPKYYYFLSNYGLGDVYFVLCFKSAIQSHLNGRVIMIVRDYHRPVLELFDTSDYIIVSDLERCDYLKDLSVKTPKKGAILPAHWIPLKKRVKDETIKDLYLKLFDLPLDTAFSFPAHIPTLTLDLKEKIESIATLDKIVFIAPEANSTKSLPRIIFKDECQRAKKEGFVVIVNALDSAQYDLEGTYNLHLSLKDAIALSACCYGVIAMRSGFCDIIAPHCHNLKVYHTDNPILIHQWNLKENGLSSNAKELTIRERLFGLGAIERTLAYRFYKRIVLRKGGFWRTLRYRTKTPFALLRLYLRYKDVKEPNIENEELLQTREYQLGLAILRIYKARFSPFEILNFLRNYSNIQKLARLKDVAMRHFRREFRKNKA